MEPDAKRIEALDDYLNGDLARYAEIASFADESLCSHEFTVSHASFAKILERYVEDDLTDDEFLNWMYLLAFGYCHGNDAKNIFFDIKVGIDPQTACDLVSRFEEIDGGLYFKMLSKSEAMECLNRIAAAKVPNVVESY